ncbi:multiple epidermal growth factor-like domains protein 10 [Trichonephila clavipes]|nr:multiple epidermal growth factor-like domains protein 10 [Trichonephila clavipes]
MELVIVLQSTQMRRPLLETGVQQKGVVIRHPKPSNGSYVGQYCEKKCAIGFYGLKCAKKCHCIHGTCNAVTGICECFAGFTGKNCDDECPANTFGVDCQYNCNCSNRAKCDPTDGSCLCPPGYMAEPFVSRSKPVRQNYFYSENFQLSIGKEQINPKPPPVIRHSLVRARGWGV